MVKVRFSPRYCSKSPNGTVTLCCITVWDGANNRRGPTPKSSSIILPRQRCAQHQAVFRRGVGCYTALTVQAQV